jgi:hypothetical protein
MSGRTQSGSTFSNTDEAGTEQHILRRGLLWSGMGGLLIAISVGVLLFR